MPNRQTGVNKTCGAPGAAALAGRLGAVMLWTVLAFPAPAIADGAAADRPSLKCEIGPITESYGTTEWLVYSCDDERSVVLIAAPGSPANPFYFVLFPEENGYRLYGEGTGSSDVTAAAFEELDALSEEDIAVLIELTQQR